MIEPQSLARFLGAYPDRPAGLVHDLTVDHPAVALPNLQLLLASASPGSVTVIDENEAPRPLDGPVPPAFMQGLGTSHPPIVLSGLDQHQDFRTIVADTERLLTPVIGIAMGPPRFASPQLFVTPPDSDIALPADASHAFILEVRGGARIEIDPGRGNASAPFDLSAGEGLYAPAGVAVRVRTESAPSFLLRLGWEAPRKSGHGPIGWIRHLFGSEKT